jgi:hypothetical protein
MTPLETHCRHHNTWLRVVWPGVPPPSQFPPLLESLS